MVVPYRWLVIVALSYFAFQVFALEPLHVVIDPGHGGQDAGATRSQYKEADIVLQISKELYHLLQKDSRFQPTLSRSSDEFITLAQRARRANQLNADLFLSIHANSSPDSRARGMEVYFQNQLPPDEESMYLASLEHEGKNDDDRYSERDELSGISEVNNIKGELRNIIQDLMRNYRIKESSRLSRSIATHWNGSRKSKEYSIHQAPFFVISNVNMPSSLVEIGFVSNSDDAKNLSDPTYQKKIAQSLYKSLIAYTQSH